MVTADPGTRRERVRAATVEEIKATALRLLVADGPSAMTLRAIAREMGMTAPGLYRYFPSHEDLHDALVAETYDRLSATLARARDDAGPDADHQLVEAARAFRDWAVEHPREFGLVFTTPVPSMTQQGGPVHEAASAFGAVFTGIFLELWAQRPFPVLPDAELPAELVPQLHRYRDLLAGLFGERVSAMPAGALHVFLRAWVQLYGLVAMEVYRHLHFCLDDVGPFFEANLHDLARMLGFDRLEPDDAGLA